MTKIEKIHYDIKNKASIIRDKVNLNAAESLELAETLDTWTFTMMKDFIKALTVISKGRNS